MRFVLLTIAKWVMCSDTGSPMQIDKESHHINKGLLLAIIILPIFVGCIMISSVCTWLYRKTYNSAPSSPQPHAFKRNLDPDASGWYHHYVIFYPFHCVKPNPLLMCTPTGQPQESGASYGDIV